MLANTHAEQTTRWEVLRNNLLYIISFSFFWDGRLPARARLVLHRCAAFDWYRPVLFSALHALGFSGEYDLCPDGFVIRQRLFHLDDAPVRCLGARLGVV